MVLPQRADPIIGSTMRDRDSRKLSDGAIGHPARRLRITGDDDVRRNSRVSDYHVIIAILDPGQTNHPDLVDRQVTGFEPSARTLRSEDQLRESLACGPLPAEFVKRVTCCWSASTRSHNPST